uniref:EGF-like domain-containing protein n=1 Tax=Hucho hucho TaxID=62062 RepID=A0A4W5KYT0_9TELE
MWMNVRQVTMGVVRARSAITSLVATAVTVKQATCTMLYARSAAVGNTHTHTHTLTNARTHTSLSRYPTSPLLYSPLSPPLLSSLHSPLLSLLSPTLLSLLPIYSPLKPSSISSSPLLSPLLSPLDVNECWSYPGRLCAQTCENSPGSYQCSCTAGFSLAFDGKNCEDLNECDSSPCGQECANIYGSYQCYCRQGFYLKEDGHTCEGITP